MANDRQDRDLRVTVRAAEDTDRIVAALEPVVDVVDGSHADLVITVGEAPLSNCASRGERRPILPVAIDAEWSPTPTELPELLGSLADRQLPTIDVHPLVVSVAESESTAAFDTTLITSEPARISEYALSVDGRPHATFRADGVVVASPLGSYGYARAAGGPQLGFGTGLAVVPIAPFATMTDTWVLQPPVSVVVERDDSVSVFADTTQLAEGRSALTVTVEFGDPLSLVDIHPLG